MTVQRAAENLEERQGAVQECRTAKKPKSQRSCASSSRPAAHLIQPPPRCTVPLVRVGVRLSPDIVQRQFERRDSLHVGQVALGHFAQRALCTTREQCQMRHSPRDGLLDRGQIRGQGGVELEQMRIRAEVIISTAKLERWKQVRGYCILYEDALQPSLWARILCVILRSAKRGTLEN